MRRQERREDRRDDRHGSDKNRYQMREKMVSFGDDYWIQNSQGQKAFKVDGKALRVRSTLNFEDAHGKKSTRSKKRNCASKTVWRWKTPKAIA